MRRALGLLLMASVLRLTAFDVLTECQRHADVAAAAAHETATAGHEHHAGMAPTSNATGRSQAPVSGDTDGESVPKCCVVTGTCGGSTLAAGLIARVSVGDLFAAMATSALNAPRTLIQAPEPPPPKA